jgi:LacI family transcriptional regulator
MPHEGRRRGPSVKDVAAAAEVSLGTVSNVLNRPERVRPATRERVESAMALLGFVRNEGARQLRAGTSRALGYVMLDGRNPFFTDVAQGIERAAMADELSLFICNSAGSAHREHAYLEHLQQQRVQGILITPLDPESSFLVEVARRGTPVVIVDRTHGAEMFCTVAVDDVLGGRLAVEHLLELGHEHVAFVGGPTSIGQVHDRLEGARQAWAEAGRDPGSLIHLSTAALSVVEGRDAGDRLAALPRHRRPTAAFCANDLLALGLLQQTTQTSGEVPGDLAIVGFDDIDFAAAAAVPLSSVRQPRQELGTRAAGLALAEAGDLGHQHEQVIFQPELVVRASSRA